MIGKRFGRLTVIEEAGRNPRRYILWKCRCDCGKETTVSSHNLRTGNTRSCGCIGKEKIKMLNYVTGAYKSRIYRIWAGMKTRCHNEFSVPYRYYGARGITVCDEWRNNFKAFYDWANENGYRDDLTIERINNDGNYCPENCRWVTKKEQARNKRNNRLITHNGETHCLSEWAEILNMNREVLRHRARCGWSDDEILAPKVCEIKIKNG